MMKSHIQEIFRILNIKQNLVDRKYFIKNEKGELFNPYYLGELKDKDFYPSPLLLEMLSSKLPSITLNKKSSWFFTLGRDLKENEVKKSSKGIVPSKKHIVINGYNEILGIAEKKGSSYHNLYDIGHFLRREI
ncbi:MAG: hypothetical protein ACQER9_00985 [Nanobdellota archaeon]